MDNERCEEHKCGGERKRSREFDRELESGPGLFDGVLVDGMSTHSEVGTSLTSSAYIEWLAQQHNRSTFDVAQGFHHTHIKDPDQAQLSSVSRETFQQCYQLYSCSSMVWQPGQQRDVVCLLRNGRARIGEATFIIDDERDSCQPALGSIPNAIFKSDSKGKIVVPVINHSKHGVALDQGDFIMHVLRMEPQQIYVVDANLDASREEEARRQFSTQENALLTLHQEWQAGDRPFFKREEGTDEKVVVATSEGMTETKTNYIADRRATSSAEHGNNEGSTTVMASTATPRCMHKQRGVLPERHNAS